MTINDEYQVIADSSKKHKIIKRQKKRMARLKVILSLLFFAVLVVLLALTPLFNISNIKVYGNNRCRAEDLIDTSGLTTGVNAFKTLAESAKGILLFRFEKAEISLLASYSYLKEATVKLKLPGTIVIRVKERIPMAFIDVSGRKLLIDDEGCILEASDSQQAISLPEIKGLKIQKQTLGQEIKSDNIEKFKIVFDVMQALQEADSSSETKLYDKVDFIDVSDLRSVKIRYDSRITINFGDLEEMAYKVEATKYLLINNLMDSKGYLDFTAGKNFNFKPDVN